MKFRSKPIHNRQHRLFIASLPCVACGKIGASQAAHIRSGNGAGMGYKSGDNFVLPLCCSQGDEQEGCHEIQGKSEERFWSKFGGIERASRYANEMYKMTGHKEACIYLMVKFKRKDNE